MIFRFGSWTFKPKQNPRMDAFSSTVEQFQQELKKINTSSQSNANYHIYDQCNFEEPTRSEKYLMTFCDGGNFPLFLTHYYLVQLNRVFISSWSSRKRILHASFDFFSMTRQNGEFLSSVVWPITQKGDFPCGIDISDNDTKVRYRELGGFDAQIRASQIPRRLAERGALLKAMEKTEGYFIADGLLQAEVNSEQRLLQAASKLADEKGLMLAGFAKTAGLLDPGVLPRPIISKKGEWYARVGEIPSRESYLYVVKFHRKAIAPYAVEVSKHGKEDYQSLFSALFSDSLDPHLPGYPHGLIDVDRRARIGHREAERFKNYFLSRLPREVSQEIIRQERAISTHDILNAISAL